MCLEADKVLMDREPKRELLRDDPLKKGLLRPSPLFSVLKKVLTFFLLCS